MTSAPGRKPYKGLPMEDPIARWYATNTQRDTRGYRKTDKAVAERIVPGSAVFEITPRPGFLAIELAKLGADVEMLPAVETVYHDAGHPSRLVLPIVLG